ncbi:MAG: cyclic nucleotide-binding domain-containing protein [Thermoflexales bacterium]|nr:cyclic nucleotide-binding domain-containing protein [Thermoflexales bacterium]
MPFQKLTRQELDRLLATQPTLLEHGSFPASSLLDVLASANRAQLADLLRERCCEPGEVICREGERGDVAYLVWSGRVAIVKGELYAPTILGYRGPGEVVGEMALLEEQPRSASMIALEPVRLLCINRDEFHDLLSKAPAIGMSLLETLSARLRTSDNVLTAGTLAQRNLAGQVSDLEVEKQHLLEAQRLRQEMADFVVHDLRNPLGIVQGALQMLDMVLPADLVQANRELLDTGLAACRRMQQLVDSLLDVSRLEAGEAELALSQVSLPELIGTVMGRLPTKLTSLRAITTCQAFSPDLPPVRADRDRLDRVLSNLLDNAVKHTPKGGKVVVAAEPGKGEVLVSVIDSGPGIPEAERERIFERFAQVAGDKQARRGFGLGLAFCRLAVEAHGGRIWVEPGEGGVGSRFVFSLPLRP